MALGLAATVVAAAGCSSNTGADVGTAVVTVTSTLAQTAVPSSSSSSPLRPDSPAPSPVSGSGPGSPGGARTATTSARTSRPGTTPSIAITTAGTTSTRTRSKPPSTPSTGDLLKDAIVLAAAAGVEPADPDAPGPDSGPACPADHHYVNEAPTGLRSDVITAWKAAVRAGKAAGITLCLNDGKRSRAQQLGQYNEYVEQYGKAIADQLVLQPNKSAHVIGIAVDVQPADAYQWLQSTKGTLGFCRIYDNEAWHFEYNPAYRTDGCPKRLPQPPR